MSDKINIRLTFEGEILKLLKEEAKKEFRSPTQHVNYILNKHFMDILSSRSCTENNFNEPEVTNSDYNSQNNNFNTEDVNQYNNNNNNNNNNSHEDYSYDDSYNDNSHDDNSHDDSHDDDSYNNNENYDKYVYNEINEGETTNIDDDVLNF